MRDFIDKPMRENAGNVEQVDKTESVETEATEKPAVSEQKPAPINANSLLNRILGVIAIIAPLVLYYLTTCPVVYFGDAGELIVAAKVWGVAHPPGYPSYIIPLGLFLRLPLEFLAPNAEFVQPVAWQANFFSAIIAALTIWIVYLILLRLTRLPVPALAAALLVSTGRTFWQQAGIAEVYALNAFLAALMVLIAIIQSEKERGSIDRVVFFRWGSIIWGLSLGNHHEMAFAFPLWLMMLILAMQPGGERRRPALPPSRIILEGIGFLAIGLLPYLYLPLAAAGDPPLNWGDPSSFRNFINVLTRAEYRHAKAAISGNTVTSLDILLHFLYWSSIQYYPVFLIAIIPGFAWILRPSVHRPVMIATAVSIFLMCAAFIVYFAGIDRPSMFFLEVYFIPWYITVGALIVAGIVWLVERIPTGGGRGLLIAGVTVLILIAAVSGARGNYRSCDMSDNIAGYVYSHDVLATIPSPPEKNILITGGDEIFLYWYWKWVEGNEKNVAYIGLDALGVCQSWFWDDLARYSPDVELPCSEGMERMYPPDELKTLMMEKLIRDNRLTHRIWMTAWDRSFDPVLNEVPVHMVLDGPVLELEWNSEGKESDYPRSSTPIDEYLLTALLEVERAGLAPFEEEIYDRYAVACYNLAIYFDSVGNHEEAVRFSSLCLQFRPGYSAGPRMQSPMAIFESNIRELGDLDLALSELEKLLEQDPNNSLYHAAMSEVHLADNDIESAMRELIIAIELYEEQAEEHRRRADRLTGQGDREAAERELESLERINQRLSLYHARMAEIFLNLGDPDAAMRELDIAIDLDPENELLQAFRERITGE